MIYEAKHGVSAYPLQVYLNRSSDFSILGDNRFIYTHYHQHLEFIVVKHGTVLFEIDAQRFTAEKGDVVIINSGKIHSAASMNGLEAVTLSLVFDLQMLFGFRDDVCTFRYLAPLLNGEIMLKDHLPFHSREGKRIRHRLQRIADLYLSQNDGFELLVKALMFSIFHDLYSSGIYIYSSHEPPQKALKLTRLKQVFEFIDVNLCDKLTVNLLAEAIHLSEAHFYAFFREMTGQSPMVYINHLRLDRALRLLLTHKWTIQDIAEKVGFDNASYFIRLFKRRYGLTPTVYAKHRFIPGDLNL